MNTVIKALCAGSLAVLVSSSAPCLADDADIAGSGAAATGVVVSNPNILPPPGNSLGWVDHPCSKEANYYYDWVINGTERKGTFALAKKITLTKIGTPQMHNDGNDVVTTFTATLHVGAAEILEGNPVNPPMTIELDGSMTVRIKDKVGKTTGTFVMSVDAMTFNLEDLATVRQDPAKPSGGFISIADLGNGAYRIDSGLDVYSQIGMSDDQNRWYWASDVNAPTHYELGTATCPAANLPVADFTASPATPGANQPVAFTDISAGSPGSWAWDFGDGGTSATRNPSHTYLSAGPYVVKLSATNGAGADLVGHLLTVAPGSGPTYTSFVWVPAASHAPGKNNSQWRTDLGLLNTGGRRPTSRSSSSSTAAR